MTKLRATPGTISACIVLVLANGCATSKHDRLQTVRFDALPSGTTLRVQPGSDQQFSAPVTLSLSPNRDYKVLFTKPGYEPFTVELKSELRLTSDGGGIQGGGDSAWVLLVPLAWALGRLLVDASTDAGHQLVPDQVRVALLPLQAPPGEAGQTPAENSPPSQTGLHQP